MQSKEEPSLLPLLHALHLQAEGGEAGQEVCHFIHLQRETQTDPGDHHTTKALPLFRTYRCFPHPGVPMTRMGARDPCWAQQSP